MNESGGPVSSLLAFYKATPEQLIVIHDELDIPYGDLRVKFGGGDNGHNGLTISPAWSGSAMAWFNASSSWCRAPTRPLPAIASSSTLPAGHLLHILPEVADGQLPRDRDVTLVRGLFTRDHPEERGLAGAVRPDQADFFPG